MLAEKLGTLAVALIVDQAFGEPPPALHPVVWIGRLVAVFERHLPSGSGARSLVFGSAAVAITLAATTALSTTMKRVLGGRAGVAWLLLSGVFLKPTFAVRELFAAGERVQRGLEAGDLATARAALRSLVSRDVDVLDAPLIAAAAVESLAENASDSIVAPCLAYLVAGMPGAYLYRAANTLDAMIGYRGDYEFFGKPAARLDDVLNLIPSRVTAALIALGAMVGARDWRGAVAIAWRDHRKTASPNAGWPMSALAGALGVQLEKLDHYRLGDATRPVAPADIAVARRIITCGLTLGLATLASLACWGAGARRMRGDA